MKRILGLLFLLTVALSAAANASLAERALSTDRAEADEAIQALRAQGQEGVDALVAAGARLSDANDVARYRAALDRVCRQRDCYASHLYWYTDLDQAKAAARAAGKPILSLRLLGNLDDEMSCANSRFFRTLLYSNPDIAAFMRENFVLHWSSERPVPKVTIDFGDGRRIQQTITGNSIHYLLDAEGQPLDALPGLYSPEAFLQQLELLSNLADAYADNPNRTAFLRRYHGNQIDSAVLARSRALRELNVKVAAQSSSAAPVEYTAAAASERAMSKMMLERPLLAQLGQPIPKIADRDWQRLAARRASGVELHPATIALIGEKVGGAPSSKMLDKLRRTLAEDTLRNEYDLHVRIHRWLGAAERPIAFDALNRQVYAELFLTPASDPWLGLLEGDAFAALGPTSH